MIIIKKTNKPGHKEECCKDYSWGRQFLGGWNSEAN